MMLALAGGLYGAKTMQVFFIDVEGGQSTLVVSPEGESLLIDTGWPGFNKRDADRIALAARQAGVKRIDYLVVTHYHTDHAGGVLQLAQKLPIRNFVDHGPSVEKGGAADQLYAAYEDAASKGAHVLAKPGDTLPVKGLSVTVVAANGEPLGRALPGAGQPGADCAAFQKKAIDPGENARSIGLMIQFGGFRMLDLGDLTWNKEYDLVCPANKLGSVDVFVVSHHGIDQSNSPQLLKSISPRVAVMNNGARKGGSPDAWQTVHDTPGLEDLWQLHFAVAGAEAHNSADPFIANVYEQCQGKWLRMTVKEDGSYAVSNSRNKYEKSYARK